MLEKIITITLVPITFLNLLGGIVGGIWLIAAGHWRIAILAFLVTVFFPWLYSLVYAVVSMPLGLLIVYLANKKHYKASMAIGFINMMIGHAINLTWVLYVVSIAFGLSESISLIPLVLVGYAVATGPFAYMASKEPPDSLGSYVAVYLTQISYILVVVLALLGLSVLVLPLVIILALVFSIYMTRTGYLMLKHSEQEAVV